MNNNCKLLSIMTKLETWMPKELEKRKVLKRKEETCILTLWKKHNDVVKKWSNVDRILLVYLCIIVCVVLARADLSNGSNTKDWKVTGGKIDKGFKDNPRCINWMRAAKESTWIRLVGREANTEVADARKRMRISSTISVKCIGLIFNHIVFIWDATRKKSHPLITVTSQSSKVLKSAKLNRRLQVFRSLSAAC
ncbi:hypothetical protein Bca4012_072511 [Brassica carinata]